MSTKSHVSIGTFALLLCAAPVAAQVCGPFNVAVTATGAGCAPSGGGIPTLSAGLTLSSPGTCTVRFTFATPPLLFASPRPVFLALGLGNPGLGLASFGWPGCTLRTTLDAVSLLPAFGSNGLIYVGQLTVPQNPVLIGTNVFAQGMLIDDVSTSPRVSLSNGLQVTL